MYYEAMIITQTADPIISKQIVFLYKGYGLNVDKQICDMIKRNESDVANIDFEL